MDYELQQCAVCGFKAKTARGFATHIRAHGLDKESYVNLYGEYRIDKIDPNKLTCPICGLHNFENVKIHMKHIHKLSDDQISEYDDSVLTLPSYREKAGRGGKETQKRFLEKHPDHVPYHPRFKSKSDASKYYWSKPEYRKMQSEKCKKQHKNGLTDRVRGRKSKFVYKEKLYMRSTWELKVAEYLDKKSIKWVYEGVCVKYHNPKSNKDCRYYPDFYLPDYNIVLEVKPLVLTKETIIQSKKNAAVEFGYTFRFVTEVELEKLDEFMKSLLQTNTTVTN